MRIYVAGSTKMIPEVNAVQNALRQAGHEITFDWTGDDGEIRQDWLDAPERARQIATAERQGVRSADAVVLVAPRPGLGLGLYVGLYVECGMAIALRIPLYVLGECKESVFWYAEDVHRLPGVGELLGRLGG